MEKTSFIASITTLILFALYITGRIITILNVKHLWKDKIIFIKSKDYSKYDIVEDFSLSPQEEAEYYGLLISKEGICNLKIYAPALDQDGIPSRKGDLIFKYPFLNIDQAIAISTMTGDLFPSLYLEYDRMDYMHVVIEWRDNLKNGVFSEIPVSKHTWKSFFYYFCR